MRSEGSRFKVSRRRFLNDFESVFTTRPDGTSWSRRDQTWKAATAYFEGLLGAGKRKTMECVARTVRVNVNKVQQFVTDSPWDPMKATDCLIDRMGKEYSSPKGVLVVDDTGQAKQGSHSVGVKRQYSGTLGKVGNCQVAVDVVYVIPGRKRNADAVVWPLGMDLYLPREWTDEPWRRTEAHIPKEVGFRTKPEIALGMIDRAVRRDLPFRCVVADPGYGMDGDFRSALRERGVAYALGVRPSSIRLIGEDIPVRRGRKHLIYPERANAFTPSRLARSLGDDEWTEVTWSEGTKGPLRALFYRTRVRVVHPGLGRRATEEVAWLLLEKRPKELKAYICHGLDDCSLEELVHFVHQRWAVERFHHEIKETLGMDNFQGRAWRGWRHHMAMICLAYAFLAVLRARARGKLPSFETVHRLVVEKLVEQVLVDRGRLGKRKARQIAPVMADLWGLPQPTE